MLAYLDASTGSMIAGAVAAGAAGVATVGRMAWYKVSPKKKKGEAASEDTVSDTEPDTSAEVAEDAEADATS